MANISKIELPNGNTYDLVDKSAVPSTSVGSANGVAPLNSSSLIDDQYLPSYVDDVVEGYYYDGSFYEDSSHTIAIAGETGKIYIDLTEDKSYRWSGSVFVEIVSGGHTYTAGSGIDISSGDVISVDTDDIQVKLVSGTNIKTINNTSVIGSGNIDITAGVSDVEVNGSSVVTSGVASIDLTGKQDTLVSGTSIKTINNTSLLGSGNIAFPTVDQTYDSTSSNAQSGVAVASAIAALPEPMIFKGSLGTGGTITSLPTASSLNEGFVYKVITDGTYASQSAKIGDTFISDGSNWVLIPSGDEPSGTVTSIGVSNDTDGGLSVSGSPITSSGTISIGHSNVLISAQSTSAVYPITIDKNGHIASYGTAVSIPTRASDIGALPISGGTLSGGDQIFNCRIANSSSRESSADLSPTGHRGITSLMSSGTMTTSRPPSVTGKGTGEGTIIHCEWDNTGGWNSQLFIADNDSGNGKPFVAVRGQRSGVWSDWDILVSRSDLAGTIQMYAGSTAPTGWLPCDGSEYLKTDYPKLYAVIGDTYGTVVAPTDSDHFRVPDFQGRVGVGAGESTATGHTAHTLGQDGGQETVTLTESTMPSHTHTQNAHSHTPSSGTNYNFGNMLSGGVSRRTVTTGGTKYAYTTDANSNSGLQFGSSTANTTATNKSTGGGNAHENMPPFIVINYIIATG